MKVWHVEIFNSDQFQYQEWLIWGLFSLPQHTYDLQGALTEADRVREHWKGHPLRVRNTKTGQTIIL